MQLQIKYNHLCGINTAKLKEIMDSYIVSTKAPHLAKATSVPGDFPFCFSHFPVSFKRHGTGCK